MQAGALFSYALLWAIVVGTAGTIVYMEMCGRVAVVAKEPVFAVIRRRLPFPAGLTTLVASNLLNLITCAAELGGIAMLLHLLTGWPERPVLAGVTVIFGVAVFALKFQWIERVFGLSGLLIIAFAVSAAALHPHWSDVFKIASDKGVIKKHVNGRLDTWVATVFLVLITVAAAAAIPLMIVTHSGQP
jgi:Mn2+/Fe2+ NRAMP family transporter